MNGIILLYSYSVDQQIGMNIEGTMARGLRINATERLNIVNGQVQRQSGQQDNGTGQGNNNNGTGDQANGNNSGNGPNGGRA